jgi:hypothetical protein
MDIDPTKRVLQVLLEVHVGPRGGNQLGAVPQRPARCRLGLEQISPIDDPLLQRDWRVPGKEFLVPCQIQLMQCPESVLRGDACIEVLDSGRHDPARL